MGSGLGFLVFFLGIICLIGWYLYLDLKERIEKIKKGIDPDTNSEMKEK
jgi:hypothetical protein